MFPRFDMVTVHFERSRALPTNTTIALILIALAFSGPMAHAQRAALPLAERATGGSAVSSVHAHLQPVKSGAWTLLSAEKAALERSPQVRSALAEYQTAMAYRTFGTMSRAGNPFVNLRAMIGYPSQSAATYSVGVGIPFDLAGRRHAWTREAGSIVAAAEARLAVAKNEVRAEARAAYVRVATAQEARGVAGQSAETAKELLTKVQAQLDARATTALDLALTDSQYAEALANLARADRILIEAQSAFRQAMGLSFEIELQVEPLASPRLPANLTAEAAVLRARRHRKESAMWAANSQRWHHADGRLRAEAWAPATAALEGEAQANRNTQTTVGAAAGFELPVVSRNQGQRAVARGEANAAQVERELAERSVEREASTTYRALVAALAELAALEQHGVPAAERSLAMVHTLLDAGVVDYFRVLTARSGAFALRGRRVEALREAWLARVALERAMGGWEQTP